MTGLKGRKTGFTLSNSLKAFHLEEIAEECGCTNSNKFHRIAKRVRISDTCYNKSLVEFWSQILRNKYRGGTSDAITSLSLIISSFMISFDDFYTQNGHICYSNITRDGRMDLRTDTTSYRDA